MSSEYIYTPLSDPDTIRVLEIGLLHPDSHQLSGRLTTESLHDQPDYVALSYVWGAPSPTDLLIDIDDHPFQVRESLFQAIRALVSDTKIRIWIDQICINQNDNTEKEQQVQLMSKIYSQARMVVGWLGDEADESDLAIVSFSYITRISREAMVEDPKLSPPPHELSSKNHAELISDIINPVGGKLGRACAALVQRPWFRRLWIVQEMALAKELELRCGTSSISGDEFFTAIASLFSAITDSASTAIGAIYGSALKLGQLREQTFTGPCESFPHLLQKICAWECEKPQDRLNGLFGVAFCRDPAAAWFKPSYSMSGPELFAMFAAEHILVTGGLEILHFKGCDDTLVQVKQEADGLRFLPVTTPVNDLASWVPNWQVRTRPLPLLTNVQDNIEANFSATASEPDYSLNRISQTLSVRAVEVDKVKMRGPQYLPFGGHWAGLVDGCFLEWLELVKHYIGSKEAESMFPLTVTMDRKVAVPGRFPNRFDPNTILDHLERHAQEMVPGEYPEKNKGYWKETIDAVTEFRYLAEELCRYRVLFVTESGRLGLGSSQVEEGDSIYLIHGLKTPFVVSYRSQGHLLRGECYVHGLMDGKVHWSDQDTTLHLR
ncbi:HET domain-containing protein [Fusarium falciforme]|uniref:HET domain-containing protein n=1 Tax=Fusarium falciforme TaxID=195108 RepID=UPI0023017CCF|nr:HET domain-containing protein [Fusarium falciforme]WAO91061.1 HET domain-containing protein [Fusarium falciforme]